MYYRLSSGVTVIINTAADVNLRDEGRKFTEGNAHHEREVAGYMNNRLPEASKAAWKTKRRFKRKTGKSMRPTLCNVRKILDTAQEDMVKPLAN